MASESPVYWPAVNPRITEEAGTRGGAHYGIDLVAYLNDPVLAPFDGTVVFVGGDGATGPLWLGTDWLYPDGEGKTIDISRADGLISRVGHLSGYAVSAGQSVTAGQTVGYAGKTGYSTGVHIHWELRWDRAWAGGSWINPRSLNPRVFPGGSSPSLSAPSTPSAQPVCRKKGPKRMFVWLKDTKRYAVLSLGVKGSWWESILDQTSADALASQYGNAMPCLIDAWNDLKNRHS